MNAATVKPLVILVDDATIAKFGPVIAELADDIDRSVERSPLASAVFARNGWTADMLAWGKFLADLAERYSVELRDRGDEDD